MDPVHFKIFLKKLELRDDEEVDGDNNLEVEDNDIAEQPGTSGLGKTDPYAPRMLPGRPIFSLPKMSDNN